MKIFNICYLKQMRLKYPVSCNIQLLLQFFGVAIHNPFRDECCVDFECCNPREDSKCWLHIDEKMLPIRREVWYEPNKPAGEPDREFIKYSKLVWKYGKS